ncbi:hypothetical protein [Nocardioides gansuensis]|uniref:hypothetical protein n=1 Tax=Nocardioides gansuensis TaxID=2138300 RepID=UPI001403566F|nr:hypothetical protein [Nocardioides gansuensis]
MTTTHTTTVSPGTQTPTPVAGEQEEAAEDDVEVKDEQPVKQPQAQEQVQEAQPEVAGTQAEIPTVVNAGLSGDSQAPAEVPLWALGLGAAGLAFLAIALILSRVVRARRGGAHAAR